MPPSKSLSARIAALAEEFPNWKHAECPLDEAESWTDDELRLYAYSGGYMLPPSRSKGSGKKNGEQIQEGLPLPPSLEILKTRLTNRGTDKPDQIKKRIDNALKEIQRGCKTPDPTCLIAHWVLNDDLKRASNGFIRMIECLYCQELGLSTFGQ